MGRWREGDNRLRLMMPADGADQLRKFDAILFGAVGSPDIPSATMPHKSSVIQVISISTHKCTPDRIVDWSGRS
jgi:hypothetical protein